MNVLESEAPAGQVYELQTTTQGTLLVELTPGGGGGSTTVSPLVTTAGQVFWIMQGSTAGGGAAVQTDTPSGAFATFAEALAATTNGLPVTLFVGPGDYSAEGLQDFGAKGVPFLNVVALSGAGGLDEDAAVIIPALDCDNMFLDGVQMGGTGTLTAVGELGARNCGLDPAGGVTAGEAILDGCLLGGAIDITTATLTRCGFFSDIGAITSVEGWNVDSLTAAALGNGSANGHFNSSTSININSQPAALMHDADRTVVLADFNQVLVLNEFTAPRTLTVDFTGSESLDLLSCYVYADVASGNTLTVTDGTHPTVLDRDAYTNVFQNQAGTLALFGSEHAPVF